MTTSFNAEAILVWFKGKARDNAEYALKMLARSEKQGYWEKGAARKVRAALNKCNIAQKFAKQARAFYDAGSYEHDKSKPDYKNAWHHLYMSMQYGGSIETATAAVGTLTVEPTASIEAHLPIDATVASRRALLDEATQFVSAMGPAYRLMKLLDSRRPKRVVVLGNLSPTVAKTLGGDRLRLDPSTIRMPPVEEYWAEVVLPDGSKAMRLKARIVWPPGTMFNRSRFLHSGNNALCQACGHAIKNPMNWVPFLIDGTEKDVPTFDEKEQEAFVDEKGTFCFLVGSDCARKLFGCTVEGEIEYDNLVPEAK